MIQRRQDPMPHRRTAARALRRFVLAALSLVLSGCGPPDAASRRPSIIVIMTDDQGYREWSAHDPVLHTPNLEQLAAEGFTLENFHVMPACSATRAALLTGRYGSRTGVIGVLNHRSGDRRSMSLAELTIAELLQQSGYRTALIGKWHLSGETGSVARYGFDHFYGFLRGSTSYVDPEDFHRNDRPLGVLQGYSTDLLADEAVAFIEENASRPFFLLFTPNAPHPYAVGKEEDLRHYSEQIPARKRHSYAAITSVDRAVGRIVQTVRELDLERDTVIVFTSDNGSWLEPRGKGTLYRGGTHVPFLAWSPGRVRSGSSPLLADVLDLFPTLAQWGGARPPDGTVLDGRSLIPLLERGDATPLHELLFREGRFIYSAFDDRHRLIVRTKGESPPPPMLFDLQADPEESHNLLPSEDPAVAAATRRLAAAIVAWQREALGDPSWSLPDASVDPSSDGAP